ncbi:MAG TPA: GDSL-type esterase/lipase family protein [Actinocrinis sp.]|nr:GDSL-type esterase/lipase family protein [Actinocrinis sp.]
MSDLADASQTSDAQPLTHSAALVDGPVDVRGALELERCEAGWVPRRLPVWTRAQYANSGIEDMVVQPSGVRLAFRTAATALELDVLATHGVWQGDPEPQHTAGFDLVVDGRVAAAGQTSTQGNLVFFNDAGETGRRAGAPATVAFTGLPAAEKDVEIWLPHHTRIEVIALRADAPITAPAATAAPRWVHHGSSISHCHAAERPTETWPVVAARLAGVEVVNLGFGGEAQADPFTARSIRDLPADLISLKLGINLVNHDTFRGRGFVPAVHGFLDTIREGHPDIPLLIVSPIICPAVEDRPGPTVADPGRADLWFISLTDPAELEQDRLSLGLIRGLLERIVAQRSADDPNLFYLDGRELFGAGDLADLPDNLHPNAAGYRRMGERFAQLVFGPEGPFGKAVAPRGR